MLRTIASPDRAMNASRDRGVGLSLRKAQRSASRQRQQKASPDRSSRRADGGEDPLRSLTRQQLEKRVREVRAA